MFSSLELLPCISPMYYADSPGQFGIIASYLIGSDY